MATLTLNVSTIEGCTKLKYTFSLTKESDETYDGIQSFGAIENTTTSLTYNVIGECSGVTTTLTTETSTLVEGFVVIPVTCLTIDGTNPIADTSIPDGLYCVSLEVGYGGSYTVSQFTKYLSLCEVCCKVKQLAASVDVFCNCDPDLNKFMSAYGLLKALQYTGLCSSDAYINKALKNLQNFLSNTKCKTC